MPVFYRKLEAFDFFFFLQCTQGPLWATRYLSWAKRGNSIDHSSQTRLQSLETLLIHLDHIQKWTESSMFCFLKGIPPRFLHYRSSRTKVLPIFKTCHQLIPKHYKVEQWQMCIFSWFRTGTVGLHTVRSDGKTRPRTPSELFFWSSSQLWFAANTPAAETLTSRRTEGLRDIRLCCSVKHEECRHCCILWFCKGTPGRFMQVGRGENAVLTDGFHLVYWGHEGRVAVPVAVLLVGSWPRRSARRRH